MSAPRPDRDAEMLARLAELDLAAVEHVHAQLVAATEPEVVGGLGRTYQRVARSLRQTLALKAKVARERADHRSRAQSVGEWNTAVRELRMEQRTLELQDAFGRIAAAAVEDPAAREDLLDRFDMELDDWIDEDDFLTADLDHQLRRACRRLDVPDELVATWPSLPPLVYAEPAGHPSTDDPPPDAAAPSPTWRSSG